MKLPLLLLSPYPLIDDGRELRDGYDLPQSSFCVSRCANRVCSEYGTSQIEGQVEFFTCPSGFSVVTLKVGDDRIRVNGVVESSTTKSDAAFRKAHRNRKISKDSVQRWIDALIRAAPDYQVAVEQIATDSISALHDIKSLIGTILQTAESWIWMQDGDTLDLKVERSPPQLRTIYQSCRIVETLLQLTDIIANPAAATFGQPRPVPVYKTLDMLQKIYESRAAKRSISIELAGRSYNEPKIYSSFLVVPLVLLDNAIKYGDKNSRIIVSIKDVSPAGVDVDISSQGDLVQIDERQLIFQRGFRGRNAVNADGSGLGLYVAQQVARANAFTIGYTGEPFLNPPHKGFNHFRFMVRGV